MHYRIHRPVLHLAVCWIFPEEVVTFPIRRGSNWSRNKSTAAIWTDISQNAFDTGHTERALIGTDTRLKRVRRQRLIAMLTGRSEFKHGVLNVNPSILGNQWFLEPFLCPSPARSGMLDRALHPNFTARADWVFLYDNLFPTFWNEHSAPCQL
jgi:hypothetical protein